MLSSILHDLSLDIGYDLEPPECTSPSCTNAAEWVAKLPCAPEEHRIDSMTLCDRHREIVDVLAEDGPSVICPRCHLEHIRFIWLPL